MIKNKTNKEIEAMKRRMYKLTKSNEKKIVTEPNDIDKLVSRFDEKKSEYKTGQMFGMAKRDYKCALIAGTRDYIIGCWQGKLDNVEGLEYSEERNDKYYNLGYYRGYNENPRGYLNDAINGNPNFSHLK